MKISKIVFIGLSLSLFVFTSAALSADLFANIYKTASGSMGLLEYRIEGQVNSQDYEGAACCIKRDSQGRAVFMTTVIPVFVRSDQLKGFQITPAGLAGEVRKCEFMGVDPVSGIGFVRTVEPVNWPVLDVPDSADIKIGMQISAVGLAGRNLGAVLQFSHGYVGGYFNVPETVYRVAGGTIFGGGSLVFDADGNMIGIVSRQLPESMTLSSSGFSGSVAVSDSTHKRYFVGLNSFSRVFKNIPAPDRPIKKAWVGVIDFSGITREGGEIYGINTPAVMIGYVVPGKTADRAGLKQRDIIVSVEGKPFENYHVSGFLVEEFLRRIQVAGVGSGVNLEVLRDSQKMNISVQVTEMPEDSWQADTFYFKQIGLVLRDKVEMDRYRDRGPMADMPGVWVLQTASKSPADKAGLKNGDLIVAVNNQPVRSVEAIKRILGTEELKEPAAFRIKRGVTDLTITVSK